MNNFLDFFHFMDKKGKVWSFVQSTEADRVTFWRLFLDFSTQETIHSWYNTVSTWKLILTAGIMLFLIVIFFTSI